MTTPPQPAPRRLRVCHIAATTEGAAWVCEQLRELRDRHGFEVAAILNGESGTLVDRLRNASIPVYAADFDFTSNADLLDLPRKVVRLVRLLRRERFDIIQTHLFHSMVIGRIAAWFADVPVRLSMIAGPFHLEAYTPRWIDRATCWTDTALIPSCNFSRDLYRAMGVAARRLEVIYYGPDETRFDPAATAPAGLRASFGWPPATSLIGMVAYFYPELPANRWIPPAVQGRSVKSQEDLIRAAPLILEEFPDARILFVGSGWEEGGRDYLRRMQALVEELGLAGRVVFTGYRTDIPAVLRDLDVSVQPSLSENLGGTIESLLMACPTVATRVGGLTDSIIDGRTGVLVEPGNRNPWLREILRLLRDPEAAARYAEAGRRDMLAGFTLRRTGERLADLYHRQHAAHPVGYRPVVAALRMVGGSVLCFGIALRYGLVDAALLPALDRGWRPWHAHRLRSRLGRLRARLRQAPAVVEPNPPPGPSAFLLVHLKHRTLYRFSAFVGRQKPGWGLRRRIRALLARVK